MNLRTIIGITLLAACLPLYAGGTLIGVLAVEEKARIEVQKKETDAQCVKHLQDIPDAKVRTADDSMIVTITPIIDPMSSLTTTSTAVMMCPNHDLEMMCLGDRCAPSQKLTMVFKLTKHKD